jgi:hypothetical protein
MTAIELIGFVFSMLFMVVVMVKRVVEEQRRRRDPERYEREQLEQSARLKAFLQDLREDMEEEEPPAPAMAMRQPHSTMPMAKDSMRPSPKAKAMIPQAAPSGGLKNPFDDRRVLPKVATKRPDSSFDRQGKVVGGSAMLQQQHDDAYSLGNRPQRVSRGRKLLQQRGSLREMVILSEILAPPKAVSAAKIWE